MCLGMQMTVSHLQQVSNAAQYRPPAHSCLKLFGVTWLLLVHTGKKQKNVSSLSPAANTRSQASQARADATAYPQQYEKPCGLTSTISTACIHASHTVLLQARSKAIKSVPATHASPSPMAGKAKLVEDPTPSRSPQDDTDCIPDTPDEGSASKAVHASIHTAGVRDPAAPGVHSTTGAKGMADPAVLVTTAVAPPASHAAVSRTRRMVPESPNEEGPPHVSPQGAASTQPLLPVHMTHQEAAMVAAPLAQQLPSQSLSHSLHLSLGIHSSGEASYPPANQPAHQAQHQAEPQAQPQAQSQAQLLAQPAMQALTEPHLSAAAVAQMATSAADHGDTSRQAAAVPLSVEAGTAGQSSGQSVAAIRTSQPPHVLAYAPVRPSCAEPPAVASATSCLPEAAAGVQAPPAVTTDDEAEAAAVMPAMATTAMTDQEAEAAAVTPAGSRHAHTAQVAGSAGMNTGSPMNDSALMAALDSAERKFMQVTKHHISPAPRACWGSTSVRKAKQRL